MVPIQIKKINSSIFELDKISSSTLKKLSDKFSYLPPGYRFQPKFRLLGINGVKVRLVRADGTFPAGLFFEVVDYLENTLGKEVEISDGVREHFYPLSDLLDEPVSDKVFSDFMMGENPVLLRDYQLGALKATLDKRYGILNLSTGAGKCLVGETELIVELPDEIVEKYELKEVNENEGIRKE